MFGFGSGYRERPFCSRECLVAAACAGELMKRGFIEQEQMHAVYTHYNKLGYYIRSKVN